ncbi:MAG TPA: phospho-N-acetylmuramoyl-pentapeptide-transferase [Candidatus Binatia bacterium]|nr:phospho-N-acetylmuramoyl-pentapeptide-transferase [Candidatus Binatia bacterium]
MNAALGLLFWALVGLAIAGASGLLLLVLLGRLRVVQHAYEDAPQTHREKTGTPTMGGLVFVVALAAAFAVARGALLGDLLVLVVLCAVIGAVDDIVKVRGGANRGLPARTKLLATALAATIFLRAIDGRPSFPSDVLFHAGAFAIAAPHWLWFVLGVLSVTGTVHAVNLTDGLDGLAAGTMIPPLALFALVAAATGVPAAAIGASTGAGACAAFLMFNRHPARLFMGDTGSLALGALLSGVAILSGEMLLLIVAGAVFVAEAVSVILQVSYFKATGGKRIFRMSPLHHHFEMIGWPETKVTARFWLASLLCSLVGWAIVR